MNVRRSSWQPLLFVHTLMQTCHSALKPGAGCEINVREWFGATTMMEAATEVIVAMA
jgi:hypothetical protein